MNTDCKIPLVEQEMQDLEHRDAEAKTSTIQQKLSVRNALSRISRLSVNNANTALYFIRENWKSGMTQAVMNMPFILNAGNNTGGNPESAYTSALIGGLLNGFFSGSNHSIYAPTWIAAGFNYPIVQEYGYEAVPWITIIIGIQIYMISHLKWHHLIDFMPNYVFEGYFSGFLFLIAHGYIDYAFGLSDLHSNRGFQVYKDRFEMYQEYFRRGDIHYFSASIAIFILLYLGWKFKRDLPLMVLVALFGVIIGILFPTEKCLKNVYGDVGLKLSFIQSGGPHFNPDFWTVSYLFVYAIKITFYLTINNLICAKGAEYITGVKCDHDQEMLCVSLTNIAAGIFNSIPCCASIRLVILNIKVRNMNRWASILNGISIIIFYGVFSRYFLQIPLYFVSGILLFTAYMCPTWSYLDMLWRTRRRLVLLKQLSIATICVYYGAIESALIGVMYSMLQFAEKMSAAASEVVLTSEQQEKNSVIKRSCVKQYAGNDFEQPNDVIQNKDDDFPDMEHFKGTFAIYRFNGAINFINVKNHVAQIKKLPECDYIVLSFRYVSVFDDEAIDKLSLMIQALISSQREVILTGLNQQMLDEMHYNEYLSSFFRKHKLHYKLMGQ